MKGHCLYRIQIIKRGTPNSKAETNSTVQNVSTSNIMLSNMIIACSGANSTSTTLSDKIWVSTGNGNKKYVYKHLRNMNIFRNICERKNPTYLCPSRVSFEHIWRISANISLVKWSGLCFNFVEIKHLLRSRLLPRAQEVREETWPCDFDYSPNG
jgi:hypothetical protein